MPIFISMILVGYPRLLPKVGAFPLPNLQNMVWTGEVIYHYDDHNKQIGTEHWDSSSYLQISNQTRLLGGTIPEGSEAQAACGNGHQIPIMHMHSVLLVVT